MVISYLGNLILILRGIHIIGLVVPFASNEGVEMVVISTGK